MEDTNNMSSVTVNGDGAAVPEKTPMPGGKKAALIVGIVLGVLVLAYLAACVVTQTVYGHTAFPHTDVLGLDVSKLTDQQIEALWAEKGQQLLQDTAVSLTEDGASIGDVPLETLGVTVTPQAAAIAAGASQRYESWGGGALAWLRGGWAYIQSWFTQTSAVPRLEVDAASLDAACDDLAASLNCTVVDGGYRLEKGEGLYITKPADGRMLDAGKLESDLTAMLQSGALTPVACTYQEKQAQTVDVQALHDQLAGDKAEAVCDKTTGEPTESRVGVAFDVAAVQAQLDAAAPGAEFLADARVEFPTVSTEELRECMFRDVLGTFTTKCAGPWGRHQNIKLASAAINGKIYNPGEEFWYNSTVGQRTAARGYQEAGVYEAGRTTTGIGGGIIAGGKLLRGKHNLAGEVGHISVDVNGLKCNCGLTGCYEAYCGGIAMANNLRRELADKPDSMIVQLAGGDYSKIDAICLEKAIRANDAYALEFWDRVMDRNAQAMGALINIFNPEMIVLGTIVKSMGPLFMDPLMAKLPKFTWKQNIDACKFSVTGIEGKSGGELAGVAIALNFLYERGDWQLPW